MREREEKKHKYFAPKSLLFQNILTVIENDGMKETVAAFQYYVEGVGILAVGSVGVVINIVALYILFRKQVSFTLKNSACIIYYSK